MRHPRKAKKWVPRFRKCLNCNQEFWAKRRDNKFHRNSCRIIYWKKHNVNIADLIHLLDQLPDEHELWRTLRVAVARRMRAKQLLNERTRNQ